MNTSVVWMHSDGNPLAPVCLAARPVTFRGTPQLLAGGLVPAWLGRVWSHGWLEILRSAVSCGTQAGVEWQLPALAYSTDRLSRGSGWYDAWDINPVGNGLTGSLEPMVHSTPEIRLASSDDLGMPATWCRVVVLAPQAQADPGQA
ncbi:unnamed protein product [Clonostachys rosea]|uniref:Uncharacterized protein n=1 Tax=Bionectria ochroleuca TaxID=29856 RepID=A0ABY6UB96_BIOOC|nr:unnamed protein product [Clonostachys rosea]